MEFLIENEASTRRRSSSANTDENSLGTLGVPSAAFLQYIIDHYDCLPVWTLFLSASGRTSFSGSTSPGRVAVDGSLRPGTGASHPLPPAVSSALLDVERLDAGFVAVGHYSGDALAANAREFSSSSGYFDHSGSGGRDSGGNSNRGLELHPAEIGFALYAPYGSHAMSFVSLEARRRGCRCDHFRLLLPGEPCERPWGWPRGGEFWASATRLRLRPLSFWRAELVALLRGARLEHGDGASRPQQGDFTTMAASSSRAGIGTLTGAGTAGPVLHAHADDDSVVPFPNSRQGHRRVRSAGDVGPFGWAGVNSSTSGRKPSGTGAGAVFQPQPSSSGIAVHRSGKALTLRDDRSSAAAAARTAAVAEKKAKDSAELAARGACLDTLWHHLLGEPLYHYQPLCVPRFLPSLCPYLLLHLFSLYPRLMCTSSNQSRSPHLSSCSCNLMHLLESACNYFHYDACILNCFIRYEYFEAMPMIPFATRCSDARQRLSAICRKLKVPNVAQNYPLLLPANTTTSRTTGLHSSSSSSSSAAASLEAATSGAAYGSTCSALHGDMLGKDVLVTPYLGR